MVPILPRYGQLPWPLLAAPQVLTFTALTRDGPHPRLPLVLQFLLRAPVYQQLVVPSSTWK